MPAPSRRSRSRIGRMMLEPCEEGEIPVVEAKGDPEVEERPGQIDRVGSPTQVPRVAPTVAVRVREVVGLPGLGREHDGDARAAEALRPHDERRIADASVVGGDAAIVRSRLSPRNGVDPFVTCGPSSRGASGRAAASTVATTVVRRSRGREARCIRLALPERRSPITEALRTPESQEMTPDDTL